MKMKTFTLTALLVLSGMVLFTPRASALSYNDGDLFLGFRASGGLGATTDLLINIGQYSALTPGTLSLGNFNQDLINIYGSNWYSRTDLYWAVVGQAGVFDTNTVFSTNPNATPWPRSVDQTDIAQTINGMGNQYTLSVSSTNSPVTAIQFAQGTNAYATFQPGGANSFGISFAQWNPTNEGNPGATLYFDRILQGSGPSQVVGTFTMNSNGTLSTTVPEPSTYAMLGIGVVLVVVAFRNKQQRNAQA